jgi:hypothetical protein
VLAHAGAADESVAVAMVVAGAWIGWIGLTRLRGRGFARVPAPAAVGMLVAAGALVIGSVTLPRIWFGPTPVATGPRIASSAALSFVEPSEGVTVRGDEIRVVLDLTGGTVLLQEGRPVTPDTGHIHLSVDGTLVSMTYGTTQIVDMRAFGPGSHTIEAAFVAADHLPFDPPVVASTTVQREAS